MSSPARWDGGARTTARIMLLAAATLLAIGATRLHAQTDAAAGSWSGSIATPGAPLAVGITLQRADDGAWTGTIDIPTQGARGLGLGDVTVNGSSVAFRLLIGAGNPRVTATVSSDGSRMIGTFTQGGATFPLELARGTVASPKRPQEPTRPFPYIEEEVTYRNAAAQNTLAGTLTRPRTGGPFPAAILITGSGAQDRDESIAGHKPFLVLADHLTRHGLAVLRVDDRGVGGSERGPLTATSQDFAGDVLAGVNYLRTRPDIDRERIGLVGHSEGANIAAMVAADTPQIAFIVMLAGTGIPGDELLYLQAAALGRLQGVPAETAAWDRTIRQRVYELLKSETDGVADQARRRALIDSAPPTPNGPAESGRQLATALLEASSGSWFRYFLAYDPAPTLRAVRCPVLAIVGTGDVQVPARENLAAIQAALAEGGNDNHTVLSLPGLNHLFQTSTTGSPAEYGTIEETFAPSALTLVSNWITVQTGR